MQIVTNARNSDKCAMANMAQQRQNVVVMYSQRMSDNYL